MRIIDHALPRKVEFGTLAKSDYFTWSGLTFLVTSIEARIAVDVRDGASVQFELTDLVVRHPHHSIELHINVPGDRDA